MKKIIYFSILFLFIFISAGLVHALEDDFNNPIEQLTYPKDFEVLLLDMVVSDNNGAADELNAITLKNVGSASTSEINSVDIWVDQGNEDFQGLTIDKKIGSFDWNSKINGWSISGLSQEIPIGGLRVFVTADLSSISNQRLLEIRPHVLDDLNQNGQYDFGDYGTFVKSDNDGPVLTKKEHIKYTLRADSQDRLAPKAFIDNMIDNSELDYTNSFTITGVAKDRQEGSIKSLQIKIDKVNGDEGIWEDVVTVLKDNKLYEWSYEWTGITPGQYNIALKAEDFAQNIIETGQITVTIKKDTAPEPPPVTTEVSLENSTLEINRDLGIMAPFEDMDLHAIVTIKDANGNVIPGKLVTLKGERPGKTTELTLMTNEQGQSLWELTSETEALFTFTATVDGKELLQHPKINFIDATLDGQLIKGESHKAVYLLKSDNKRYVFPTESIFKSYYANFDTVKEISDSELAQYMLGGNITYRPGSLIKVPSLSKVYRVKETTNNINFIEWIETEELAKKMYGPAWASLVHDVNDSFFIDYTLQMLLTN